MIIDKTWKPIKAPLGFIVVEGVNGSGKSALIKKLSEYCESRSRAFIVTREPGGTRLGEILRGLVQEGKAGEISSRAELLLFGADRAEHVEGVIKPALYNSKIVISDRFSYSSEAFQGYGRGLDHMIVGKVNEIAIDGTKPDIVILLDLPPEVGLSRTSTRAIDSGDTFEKENLEFHERIRRGFLEIAKLSSEPFYIIDALRSEEEVFQEALGVLRPVLDA